MDEAERPIIIKKIKKGGHGHHGGAWKVAFADFATAMMAFFLLLWLLATASPEQKQAISAFFDAQGAVGEGGGFSDSMIDLGGVGDVSKGSEGEEWKDESSSGQTASEIAEEAKQMEELLEILKQAIDKKEELKAFKDQLKLNVTPEGLRIQIVDKENRPMFQSGQAIMRDHAVAIINEIAPIINQAGNRISISGHTDAARFVGRKGYSNWELSADRANAARRALIAAGMNEKKVGRVVGLADSSLYNPNDPFDPINRRISIVVMNKATDDSIGNQEGAIKVDSAESFGNSIAPKATDSLEGIPQTVIDSAKAISADNVIIDTLKGPELDHAPSGDPAIVEPLPIPLLELNDAALDAVQPPAEQKPAPLSKSATGVPVIELDFGGDDAAPASPVKPAPPANKAPANTKPKPEPAAKAPPEPVTPGAVPLSLPGL